MASCNKVDPEMGTIDCGLQSLGPCYLVPAGGGCGCGCGCGVLEGCGVGAESRGFLSGILCGVMLASFSILSCAIVLCVLVRFVPPSLPVWI